MKTAELPLIPLAKKWPIAIVGCMIFIIAYSVLGNFHLSSPTYLPLSLIDGHTPFLPWTIIIYMSDYLFIFVVIWNLKDARELSLLTYRSIIVMAISFSAFLFFPTIYPRLELSSTTFWSYWFLVLHSIDAPTNCLPSLHVSLTLLGSWSLGKLQGWKKAMIFAWAAAICLSTLTTKQHYAIDVLGGFGVASLAICLTRYIDFPASLVHEKSVNYEENKRAS